MYEMLLDGLPNIRRNYMRGLADAAEDQGNHPLAKGWRWLADNRRWPAGMKWGRYGFRMRCGPLRQMAEYGLPPAIYRAAVRVAEAAGVGYEDGALRCQQSRLPEFLAAVAAAVGNAIDDGT